VKPFVGGSIPSFFPAMIIKYAGLSIHC
jgi:hypothetical protein